jgi:hypothetical protein
VKGCILKKVISDIHQRQFKSREIRRQVVKLDLQSPSNMIFQQDNARTLEF